MVILLIIFITSIFLPGFVAVFKAKIVGRKGPSLFQHLNDLIKLSKKGSVYSITTSIIFKLAPIIYISTILTAVLFIPIGDYPSIIAFKGDFVFFAYLISLGKFVMILGAMDTGSSFEGMGANREAYYSLLVEPAFFTIIASFVILTGNTSFSNIFVNLQIVNPLSYLTTFLSVYVLFWISMIELSRMPVDDPKTHLELTMIHEVMILDYSGFDLVFIHLANWIKFALYGTIIFNIILPVQKDFFLQLFLYPFVQIIYGILIVFVETFRARNKMNYNPQWIFTLSALSIIIYLSVLIITEKIIF